MTQEALGLQVTSSTEPAWALEAQECYRHAVQALREAEIRCAVGGSFAIHKHTGIWRATKDLDVLLVAGDVPRALRQLELRGFETYIEDPVWLAKARREGYFVDLITGMGNAALIVDESWIDRSVDAEVLGIACKVLAPEEMIAAKVFIGFRERFDGSDIMHLIRACGKQLDWDRLMELLGEHLLLLYWSLVLFAYVYPARTDLVPKRIWSEMAERLGEQVEQPKKDAPFRGTLVDPKMFAIDVNEWGERDLLWEYCERHPSLLRTEDSTGSAE
jgi:hypothetical protein